MVSIVTKHSLNKARIIIPETSINEVEIIMRKFDVPEIVNNCPKAQLMTIIQRYMLKVTTLRNTDSVEYDIYRRKTNSSF